MNLPCAVCDVRSLWKVLGGIDCQGFHMNIRVGEPRNRRLQYINKIAGERDAVSHLGVEEGY